MKEALARETEAVVDDLTPDERLLLKLRFGEGQRPYTLDEVAGLFGVSRQAVTQIEFHALRKLRLSAVGPISEGWQGWDEV